MAKIKPFKALRPEAEYVKQVSCVPYDVVYTSEVHEYIAENPRTFLRVTRAEAEFENYKETPPETIFARAKENLEKFLDDKLFFRDDEDAIYIYQISYKGKMQTGIVACVRIDDYDDDVIKKHEKTRPDKVNDRTEHMLALRAQTGLIFLGFRNTPDIKGLIGDAVSKVPEYDFECDDGVRQIVWKITDTPEWLEAFEEVKSLYIADGHHRAKSASIVREKLHHANAAHTGEEAYNFVIAGLYPAEDLSILAYNRVVKDLNDLSNEVFLERISETFLVKETAKKVPTRSGELCMYLGGKWYQLIEKQGNQAERNAIETLDVSILHKMLLEPILEIGDERIDKRIGHIGGVRGTQYLENMVDDGSANVAFSLYPTTMEQLFAVTDSGGTMPPKSTWFEPKLKDGLFVYQI